MGLLDSIQESSEFSKVSIRAGKLMRRIGVKRTSKMLYFRFGYNKKLLGEIRNLDGARWDHERKIWSAKISRRTEFAMEYLMGGNPYKSYKEEPDKYDIVSPRPLFEHQKVFIAHAMLRRSCVIAGEMGTGKTLAAGEVMERSGHTNWLWIGPKSALASVQLEFRDWELKIVPEFWTYERLTKNMEDWGTRPVPRGIVFDECSRLKNPTTKRSQAAAMMGEWMWEEYGDAAYMLEMSGTPAPNAPEDWWHVAEIAQPGFLKEGSIYRMKETLCLTEMLVNPSTGQEYPHVITYWDDENKCKSCGQLPDHDNHTEFGQAIGGLCKGYKKSINEIDRLYRRLKGLVHVAFKKDCLDLPNKRYITKILKPKRKTLNAAKLLAGGIYSGPKAVALLKELSDGFQYKEVQDGTKKCELCKGIKTIDRLGEEVTCPTCSGQGIIPKMIRTTERVYCPKVDALKEILDEHVDAGRIVVYAGFTGGVDICAETAQGMNWSTLRVDGRGFQFYDATQRRAIKIDQVDALDVFKHPTKTYGDSSFPRLCFVGHPEAAGEGLNLTSAPTCVFYSNSNKSNARVQAEDRIHRAGMDVVRGATIIDLIHLPSDQVALDNIRKKRDLELMTLGELQTALEKGEADASD